MADRPSIQQVVKEGRVRTRRQELVLGAILLGGGMAVKLGMRELTGGMADLGSYGAIGLGAVLVLRGLFG